MFLKVKTLLYSIPNLEIPCNRNINKIKRFVSSLKDGTLMIYLKIILIHRNSQIPNKPFPPKMCKCFGLF